MDIKQIDLFGFTSHDDTKVKLPERGLVLVTGENGAGKSSLMEGVSWSCWGKTLRGSDPWRSDSERCLARVWLHERDLPVERVRQKGKSLLSWSDTTYETTTKAQEALERAIGPFDIWRRTHVFSSQDAAHFSLATDSERKRLLEAILGLERFDAALDACRADIKIADAAYQKLAVDHARLKTSLDESRRRLREHEAHLQAAAPAEDPVAGRSRLGQWEEMIKKANTEIRARQRAVGEVQRGDGWRDHGVVDKKINALKDGHCPTCEQGIPDSLLKGLRDRAQKERDEAAEARSQFEEKLKVLDDEIAELEEERDALSRRHADLAHSVSQAEKAAKLHSQIAQVVASAQAEVERLVEAEAQGGRAAASAQTECATLRTVEQVLGLKGVRAHVLGRALTGVEAMANNWLARIAGDGLSVNLKSYSEKKTGGVSDAISLDVVGAGGGRGYRAASGGERRRIDVALLLALADVASAARGVQPGTMFFDEVFDALDGEGIEAVSAVLGELAQQRVVIVISHSGVLAKTLEPDLRLHVSGGKMVGG